MGFFSDFLTWLKGRNLCPSLMNDKQELEKLGEYEEENGLTGQLYQHRVWVYVYGENNGYQFLYIAVNNIPDNYASIPTGTHIAVPDFNEALIKQGFVPVTASDQNGNVFVAWIAESYEADENVYGWRLSTLGKAQSSTESLASGTYTVVSNEAGQRVEINETVTPYTPV